MERNIDMSEVSDGKRYQARDMVKAGCNDCAGCSLCCHGMGDSIILDPYDVTQLQAATGMQFEQLLSCCLELHVVDGIILPNLKMKGEEDACYFLNEQGRCSIHAYRPGFCRLFPLGRIYEENGFDYFLQVHECPYPQKNKVKIQKWLDIPQLSKYENYINNWHYFLKEMQEIIQNSENETISKNLNLYILSEFFQKPFQNTDNFYLRFQERLYKCREKVVLYK